MAATSIGVTHCKFARFSNLDAKLIDFFYYSFQWFLEKKV